MSKQSALNMIKQGLREYRRAVAMDASPDYSVVYTKEPNENDPLMKEARRAALQLLETYKKAWRALAFSRDINDLKRAVSAYPNALRELSGLIFKYSDGDEIIRGDKVREAMEYTLGMRIHKIFSELISRNGLYAKLAKESERDIQRIVDLRI